MSKFQLRAPNPNKCQGQEDNESTGPMFILGYIKTVVLQLNDAEESCGALLLKFLYYLVNYATLQQSSYLSETVLVAVAIIERTSSGSFISFFIKRKQ